MGVPPAGGTVGTPIGTCPSPFQNCPPKRFFQDKGWLRFGGSFDGGHSNPGSALPSDWTVSGPDLRLPYEPLVGALDYPVKGAAILLGKISDVVHQKTYVVARNATQWTTLKEDLSDSSTSIYVDEVAGAVVYGYLTIDDEVIQCGGIDIDGNVILGSRGALGTTASTHSSGAMVSWLYWAVQFNVLDDISNGAIHNGFYYTVVGHSLVKMDLGYLPPFGSPVVWSMGPDELSARPFSYHNDKWGRRISDFGFLDTDEGNLMYVCLEGVSDSNFYIACINTSYPSVNWLSTTEVSFSLGYFFCPPYIVDRNGMFAIFAVGDSAGEVAWSRPDDYDYFPPPPEHAHYFPPPPNSETRVYFQAAAPVSESRSIILGGLAWTNGRLTINAVVGLDSSTGEKVFVKPLVAGLAGDNDGDNHPIIEDYTGLQVGWPLLVAVASDGNWFLFDNAVSNRGQGSNNYTSDGSYRDWLTEELVQAAYLTMNTSGGDVMSTTNITSFEMGGSGAASGADLIVVLSQTTAYLYGSGGLQGSIACELPREPSGLADGTILMGKHIYASGRRIGPA